jgi:hypothetical protein
VEQEPRQKRYSALGSDLVMPWARLAVRVVAVAAHLRGETAQSGKK